MHGWSSEDGLIVHPVVDTLKGPVGSGHPAGTLIATKKYSCNRINLIALRCKGVRLT